MLSVPEGEASSTASYDEDYYEGHLGGPPYRRGEPHWHTFFKHVADNIVSQLAPETALDVGCAIGFLVEALRAQEVDARGIDTSEFAISQVPDDIRSFCRVRSVTDEIEGQFDLITCIEVVEHMPGHLADAAIANVCRHTDTVLFSSSPDDFEEPTHLNVQASDYWIGQFARHGFFRDFYHDASYLAPHAVLFRRRPWSAVEIAQNYERAWWQAQRAAQGARSRRDKIEEDLKVAKAQLDGVRREGQRREEQLTATGERLSAERDRLETLVEERTRELEVLRQTRVLRYTAPLRRLYGRARHTLAKP